jgi:osmoprotectant transport system permease protein
VSAVVAQQGPVIPDFGRGSECVRDNRFFCWDWASDHWDDTLQPRLLEHLELTLYAVGIGFAIAFAAALVVHRLRWLEAPVGTFAAFLYTVPSLALFQLLVPITGLSVTTVEIALVGYTLLILFRNILAGLRGVPEDVLEAARGMGLTARQTLLRVQLPLAVPSILAGIRIATVTTISLATIAAFILPRGLGQPILDGLATGFNTKFVAAGALAVAVALVADALLVLTQRALTPWATARRVG